MSEQDRFEGQDRSFIERERRNQERLHVSQEAADRNFKEGLRAAFRDASTRDAIAAGFVRAARDSETPRVAVRTHEGFEGI